MSKDGKGLGGLVVALGKAPPSPRAKLKVPDRADAIARAMIRAHADGNADALAALLRSAGIVRDGDD